MTKNGSREADDLIAHNSGGDYHWSRRDLPWHTVVEVAVSLVLSKRISESFCQASDSSRSLARPFKAICRAGALPSLSNLATLH
jgi:hypothetical protein